LVPLCLGGKTFSAPQAIFSALVLFAFFAFTFLLLPFAFLLFLPAFARVLAIAMDEKRPLKILQVASHSDATRGGAMQMILLARGLMERGHEVECVFHAGDVGAQHAAPPQGGTGILPVNGHGQHAHATTAAAGLSPLQTRLFNLNRWTDMLRFRAWIRREGFDVIHSHRDPALRFCFLATLGLDVPAFVTQRGTVYRLPRWGIVRWAFRSRKLDRVIAVAEAVRRALIVNEGLAPEKVSVVYGGYDPERFHRGVSGDGVRREFALSPEVPLVGIVGALVGKKGHADFFEAAAQVVEMLPAARFLVVGGGKPDRFELTLTRLGLSERVIFTGYRSDMPEVLAALDVAVCASTKGEGLTGTLREAMAVGTPVVTTDVAGNTELVVHEETGLVVSIGASSAMAKAIVRLLKNRDEANGLSATAEEHVRQLCLNSRRCERVEQIYCEIIESKQKAKL
jgi:glycosyltransferase involved in cell wall biosynthesis